MKTRISVKWNEHTIGMVSGTVTLDQWENMRSNADKPDKSIDFEVTVTDGTISFHNLPYELFDAESKDSPLYEKLKLICQAYYDGWNRTSEQYLWEL